MDYEKDVEEDAYQFLIEHADDFKDALRDCVEFDWNDIRCLDDDWHYAIVDRGYSPADAVYILDHCENEETDSGLWGGYPLGRSYIDARCGSGHGMPDIKEYVDFDHDIAEMCPWLRGMKKHDIAARLVTISQPPQAAKEKIN